MSENRESNVVILGSARRDSNTLRGILKVVPNNNYTLVDLLDYEILQYEYDHTKLQGDGFIEIVDMLLKAETITFATPVYWYSMSGRMKVFFDRLTELLNTHKSKGKALSGKNVYLVVVGAEAAIPDGFEVPFKRTAEYFGMNFKKTFYEKI